MLTGTFPNLEELIPNESEAAILTKFSMVVATLPLSQVIIAPILGKQQRIRKIVKLMSQLPPIFKDAVGMDVFENLRSSEHEG